MAERTICSHYDQRSAIEVFRIDNVNCGTKLHIELDDTYQERDIEVICQNECEQYAVYAVNRDGGFTSCLFEGRPTEATSFEAFDIYNPRKNDLRQVHRISTESRRRWTLHTSKVPDSDTEYMMGIATSTKIWLHDLRTDQIYPVICTDNQTTKRKKINTPRAIVIYTMTFEEARRNIRR